MEAEWANQSWFFCCKMIVKPDRINYCTEVFFACIASFQYSCQELHTLWLNLPYKSVLAPPLPSFFLSLCFFLFPWQLSDTFSLSFLCLSSISFKKQEHLAFNTANAKEVRGLHVKISKNVHIGLLVWENSRAVSFYLGIKAFIASCYQIMSTVLFVLVLFFLLLLLF